MTGTNDDDAPLVVEAEFAPNLVDEVFDVVTDTPGAVTAHIRQVFANFRCVHCRKRCKFVRGDICDLVLKLFDQQLQIDRKPGDGRIRNAST